MNDLKWIICNGKAPDIHYKTKVKIIWNNKSGSVIKADNFREVCEWRWDNVICYAVKVPDPFADLMNAAENILSVVANRRGRLEKLHQAVQAVKEMEGTATQWKNISTYVPDDDVENIDVWTSDYGRVINVHFDKRTKTFVGWSRFGMNWKEVKNITHWIDIPKQPKVNKQ